MPRLRFYLQTPIAISGQKPPHPLMLDGILGYAWALRNGYGKTPAEVHPENLVFPELPLEKIGERCYAASAAFLPPEAAMYPTLLVRCADWKSAMARYGCPETAYDVAAGWRQAHREPYWLLSTPYVDFYYRGDNQGVTGLLSIIFQIRFLGGKRAAGYGQIRKIELKEKAADWSVWRDGRPTRPVPVKIAGERKDLTPEWTTYYPPYWAAANNAWCYTPPVEQWLPVRKAKEIADTLELFFAQKKESLPPQKGKEKCGEQR